MEQLRAGAAADGALAQCRADSLGDDCTHCSFCPTASVPPEVGACSGTAGGSQCQQCSPLARGELMGKDGSFRYLRLRSFFCCLSAAELLLPLGWVGRHTAAAAAAPGAAGWRWSGPEPSGWGGRLGRSALRISSSTQGKLSLSARSLILCLFSSRALSPGLPVPSPSGGRAGCGAAPSPAPFSFPHPGAASPCSPHLLPIAPPHPPSSPPPPLGAELPSWPQPTRRAAPHPPRRGLPLPGAGENRSDGSAFPTPPNLFFLSEPGLLVTNLG